MLTVDDCRDEHCSRQDVTSVFELFGQMYRGIATKICCCGADHADHGRETDRAPAVVVGEGGEGLFSVGTWTL